MGMDEVSPGNIFRQASALMGIDYDASMAVVLSDTEDAEDA